MSAEAIRHDLALLLIGAQLFVALLFAAGHGNWRARLGGAALMLGVVGYLAQMAALVPDASPGQWVARGLAISVPYVLYEFGRVVFETRGGAAALRFVYLVPLALYVGAFLPSLDREALVWLDRAHHLAGMALTLYLVSRIVREQGDDLLAPRRRYRFLFVALIALHVTAVLAVELLVGLSGADVPVWLEVVNLAAIGALTLLLAVPLLSTNPNILWFDRAEDNERRSPVTIDDPLASKLRDVMQAGGYRRTGLSIGALASDLGVPEHRLRRLINQVLGYRNFSEFLNSYRLDAAAERLADRSCAQLPVLSIALDVGYGSIGPFNRAFRQRYACTPSEFRRRELADSEKT